MTNWHIQMYIPSYIRDKFRSNLHQNLLRLTLFLNIVSEYAQEIPQWQTADRLMAEPHDNHETPLRQTKQRNQLSLSHQDDCKTRMDIKYRTTIHRTITQSHNGSNTQQWINNESTTTEPPPYNGQQPKLLGGLNAFYWYLIFTLESAVVEAQTMLSLYGGFLTIAMYHHGETN